MPAEIEEMPWPDIVDLMAEFQIRAEESKKTPQQQLAEEASAAIKAGRGVPKAGRLRRR